MDRTPKQPKKPALIKRFFAPNLVALIDLKYGCKGTRTERAIALSKDSGVGKNTIIRGCDPDDPTSISIDNLERLANCLNVLPYQLLIPYLDVKSPQVAHSLKTKDKDLYLRFNDLPQTK